MGSNSSLPVEEIINDLRQEIAIQEKEIENVDREIVKKDSELEEKTQKIGMQKEEIIEKHRELKDLRVKLGIPIWWKIKCTSKSLRDLLGLVQFLNFKAWKLADYTDKFVQLLTYLQVQVQFMLGKF